MKKNILIIILTISVSPCFSQVPKHSSDFNFGNGINFLLNDGKYQFNFGGSIQPQINISSVDSVEEYFYNSPNSLFSVYARDNEKRITLFMLNDFSKSNPLLDAWGAIEFNYFNIAFGQRHAISNFESMLFENNLTFNRRSLMNQAFNSDAREFGIFISSNFSYGDLVFEPNIALTSGDGINSFGTLSSDYDLGGLKYAFKLNIYPFGEFNVDRTHFSDLSYETDLKIMISFGGSYNDGASNSVGEGHGDFNLYDESGDPKYPDYRKLHFDLLSKYQGFSFLAEYMIATATDLEGSYKSILLNNDAQLLASEISEFLSLGSGLNTQLGYMTKSGLSIDLAYSMVEPEFENNTSSIISKASSSRIGFSKYLVKNAVRLHTGVESVSIENQENDELRFNLMLQLNF
ncbi:hypothetical protein OA257_00445 [Bacteroidota bacterium]|nr:hypothetical protein [Bacteroidota bacterium]